jgi:hypothetical protein
MKAQSKGAEYMAAFVGLILDLDDAVAAKHVTS